MGTQTISVKLAPGTFKVDPLTGIASFDYDDTEGTPAEVGQIFQDIIAQLQPQNALTVEIPQGAEDEEVVALSPNTRYAIALPSGAQGRITFNDSQNGRSYTFYCAGTIQTDADLNVWPDIRGVTGLLFKGLQKIDQSGAAIECMQTDIADVQARLYALEHPEE